MKPNPRTALRRYRAALRDHLTPTSKEVGIPSRPAPSVAGVDRVLAADLVEAHERLLLREILPNAAPSMRASLIQKAAEFLAVWGADPHADPEMEGGAAAFSRTLTAALGRRATALASDNLVLARDAVKHTAMESSMRIRERSHARMLANSERLQAQLRKLSRQVLSAQEDERRRISRELHDVIAQALSGINLRLANLKLEASKSTKSLDRNIARTQRLVEDSVNTVHRFARELRPAALDDLGLGPALRSHMEHFTSETGIRTRLDAFDGLQALSSLRRTALYRIAQEALSNVARHSGASNTVVTIDRLSGRLRMRIVDDGRSFDVAAVQRANSGRRLGLLGMRERAEMIGGRFSIASAPGRGTTVEVLLPFHRRAVEDSAVRKAPNPREPGRRHP